MTVRFKRYFRVSRKLGVDLWGSSKDAVHKRNYRPGVHGRSSVRGVSDYGKQLSSQLAMRTYYCMKQYQLKNVYKQAERSKGNTIDNLVIFLERRLSAVLFRAGFYPTMRSAQIAISHKHVKVNGIIVNSASYLVSVGSVIEIINRQKNNQNVLKAIDNKNIPKVGYLSIDVDARKIEYLRNPDYSEVPYSFNTEMHLVVEFFSKMA